jgi:BirA family biotin operon repressor/biotin-[acetyl-CoA-carboxylase] ligase
MTGPPDALVSSLVDGPSAVAAFEWHDEIGSTNARATELAAQGAEEITVVAADVQHAGRGRLGRAWSAPPGTSLMLSLVLRPPLPAARLPLLPLLTGVTLVEVADRVLPGATVALKWPNDVLLGSAEPVAGLRKTAGILAESAGGAVVVGMGINVDWRGVHRPPELADRATSLAEVAGADVDRWRVLAALLGVFANRYRSWCALPGAFLDGYRARCSTIGQDVVVTRPSMEPLRGTAVGVAGSGALQVRDARAATVIEVAAGDVTHVRPA